MKHDLKNYKQGINASVQVTQELKVAKRITLAVSCLGSVIGALCVVAIVIVLFEGSL